MVRVKSNHRLYYDSSKQVLLEEGSAAARFLAFPPGTILSGKEAEDYERFLKGKNETIAEGAMSNRPESSQPFQEYPIMLYHMDGNYEVVRNGEKHQELGPQWFQSPAHAIAASPALWFPTQLQGPISEAVSGAYSRFQMAKSRIVQGGPITEIDLKSLTVQFVLDVFPAIADQAGQLLKEGLCTKHRFLNEVDKCLRHLVRHATHRIIQRLLNDKEFHAWVLHEVKGDSAYKEALQLALNEEFPKPDTEERTQPEKEGQASDASHEDPEVAKRRAIVRQNPEVKSLGLCEITAVRGKFS